MLRRVLFEQRRFLTLLAIALAANVVVYAALVYPLANRVADASERSAAAESERRSATRELAAARAVATGKDRAEAELETFYEQVLPADASSANRSTYLTLAQLARKTNLRITRRQAAPHERRDSRLEQLAIQLSLEGSYEDIRRFIYELESAPAFVVIDEMAIARAAAEGEGLVLSLSLSTYYRASDDAS